MHCGGPTTVFMEAFLLPRLRVSRTVQYTYEEPDTCIARTLCVIVARTLCVIVPRALAPLCMADKDRSTGAGSAGVMMRRNMQYTRHI